MISREKLIAVGRAKAGEYYKKNDRGVNIKPCYEAGFNSALELLLPAVEEFEKQLLRVGVNSAQIAAARKRMIKARISKENK